MLVRGRFLWMVPVALAAALVPAAALPTVDVQVALSGEPDAPAVAASVSGLPDGDSLALLQRMREAHETAAAEFLFGSPSAPEPSPDPSAEGDQQSPAGKQARAAADSAIGQARETRSQAAEVSKDAQGQAAEVTATLPEDPLAFATGAAQKAASNAAGTLPALLSAGSVSVEPQSGGASPVVPDQGMMPPLLAGSLLVAGAAGATFFAFWLAGSSGTAATGMAAKGGELRRLLPFASPLFTRFEKETVLGHPRREALYALILQQPGISLQTLGESTGLSRTAVLHHLRLMEMQHLVVSKRMGRSRHYYENGGRYGRDAKEAYAVLQNPRSKEVAEFIRTHPGAMQKQLCEALAIQPSIAHWHVRRLQGARLVDSVRQGRAVNYFPGTSLLEVAAQPPLPPAPEPPAALPVPLLAGTLPA